MLISRSYLRKLYYYLFWHAIYKGMLHCQTPCIYFAKRRWKNAGTVLPINYIYWPRRINNPRFDLFLIKVTMFLGSSNQNLLRGPRDIPSCAEWFDSYICIHAIIIYVYCIGIKSFPLAAGEKYNFYVDWFSRSPSPTFVYTLDVSISAKHRIVIL